MRSTTKSSSPSSAKRATRTTKTRASKDSERTNGHAPASMREEVAAYRQDIIVRVAAEAFYEHGYHDCTVDMIAERLSGTKAIVYYYFPDKRSILEEIFRRAIAEAQEVIRVAIETGSDPRAKLEAFARLYAKWVVENQHVVAILWREERSISEDARIAVAYGRRTMDDLVALIIREGVSKGQFLVEDVRTTARAIAGMISYSYSWWQSDKRLTSAELGDFYANMSLRIVGTVSENATAE